jgi:hypothetical protein
MSTRTISKERLNQIASRKLTELKIATQLASDGETLVGELRFPGLKVLHPQTNAPLSQARFRVVGHDQVQMVEPPLQGLGPIPFYDATSAAQLEDRVGQAVRARVAQLKQVASKLSALRLSFAIEPVNFLLTTQVKTAQHQFELHVSPSGARIARVAPLHGKPFEVAGDETIDLTQFSNAIDLELELSERVKHLKPGASASTAAAAAPAPKKTLSVVAPPAQSLRLTDLVERFGAEAYVSSGKPLEIAQDVELGGQKYRFVATHDSGSAFRGKIVGPDKEHWSDKFDLGRFPGVRQLFALVFGGELAKPEAPTTEVASHLQPHVGEVWVMNVVIEREDAGEVRYACVDINGRPYGAARILSRKDFEAVFCQVQGGWRLLIVIEQVEPNSVVYRQMDNQRQPRGSSKSLNVGTLVANFVPEAAAY